LENERRVFQSGHQNFAWQFRGNFVLSVEKM